ncbi:MAG: GntR family transcriptional regulator [Acuticoccus sp.]
MAKPNPSPARSGPSPASPSRPARARAPAAQAPDVVQALEDDIIFGRLRPDDRLVEDQLMERYGAKRHVVRQAFWDLEKLGIVLREPNKGARIRAFSPKEVANIYDMRALLQGHAAMLVPMPAPPTLMEELEAIHVAHSQAVDAQDLRAVFQLNNAFHDVIFSACGNDLLAEEIRRFLMMAHAIRSYRIGDPRLLQQARDEHAQMLEYLRSGERGAFARLCAAHIEPSRRAYLKATAEAGAD